jgi:hypothetical protein
MTNAHGPIDEPRDAASLFLDITDDLNRLGHIIEGVFMAAGDISGKEQQAAMRELLDVANQKIAAMKETMEEARDTLEREQPENNPT